MRKWILAALAVALSAIALWFGTGLHPVWWLTWLAPLLLLLAAPLLRGHAAFGMAALTWLLGEFNVWAYLHRLEIPTAVVLALYLIPALVFATGVSLYRVFWKRGLIFAATFALPVLWVSYEFLWSSVSPHSTFFNLGYTQMDCLPVLQIVSVTGIWGISFCLFLAPVAIAVLVSRTGGPVARMRLAGAVAVILAAVLSYGFWRLGSTTPTGEFVTVALAASDILPASSDAGARLVHDYADKIDALAAQGAHLIVLPEKIAIVSDEATGKWDDAFATAARRGQVMVVAGLDRGGATRRWNEARVYSSAGTLEGTYDKHHMIPGFEDIDQPGSALLVMNGPASVWGVEICKDMDFPALSREYGARKVGLLIVPAWDFVQDGWLHGRMAVMRGVESGFTIARSAKQGLLTVSDDRGRILAERHSSSMPMGSVVATAPVRHTDTTYVRFGDWFGWANFAGLLVILALPWFRLAMPAGRT